MVQAITAPRTPAVRSCATAQGAVDTSSVQDTFEFLCHEAGVEDPKTEDMEYGAFQLAFEKLFNNEEPLDIDSETELRTIVDSFRGEDVGLSDWAKFHDAWTASASASSYLASVASAKQKVTALEADRRRVVTQWQQRERELQQKMQKMERASSQRKGERPELLADKARESRQGALSEEREEAALVSAQYRSLDPAEWAKVTSGVGGLEDALETIRRRIWVPLCAPRFLLDELGAERVKGLLLYGPPGCGKSYLAARLAAGLSRRPPTIVSGPEVMDK